MNTTTLRLLALSLLTLVWTLVAAPVPLFDGRSLAGWDGDTNTTWRLREGVIVGGSLAGNPRNEFLATRRPYTNFILRLEYKLVGTEGFVNGGAQIRSRRIPNPPNEMSGYQADIGAGHSGSLYDESRRNRMLAVPDKDLIRRLEKTNDWNRYEVRCEGTRVRLFLNGELTVDYTETESAIEQHGLIALQIHGNCKAEISFRNISIEELPASPAREARERTESLQRLGDARRADSRGPFGDQFVVQPNDVIAWVGQANFVRHQKSGELELALAAQYAPLRPRFRWMAWEGDTVYEQWRDMNFGSWAGQFEWAGVNVVIAQFGQMEALDGPARLEEFLRELPTDPRIPQARAMLRELEALR